MSTILFQDGIDAQPEALARSAETVRTAVSGLPCPPPGALVALVGIGASEHVARSAAPVWRDLGLRAVSVSAAELQADRGADLAEVYVAMSESGRSAETIATLRRSTGRRIGLTNFADSAIADVVDELVPLGSGPDSPVYTTGYTATLQAVGLLGEHWAGTSSDWSMLPALVSRVLAESRPVIESVLERFDEARIIDVVGSRASSATAGEGALLLRESARAHTASHETYNYLHGPMEPLDPSSACIVVGDGRELRLAREVSDLGCPTLLVTTSTEAEPGGNLTVLRLPEAPSVLARTVLEILPLQLLGWDLARGRGLRVDGFRYEQDDIKLVNR